MDQTRSFFYFYSFYFFLLLILLQIIFFFSFFFSSFPPWFGSWDLRTVWIQTVPKTDRNRLYRLLGIPRFTVQYRNWFLETNHPRFGIGNGQNSVGTVPKPPIIVWTIHFGLSEQFINIISKYFELYKYHKWIHNECATSRSSSIHGNGQASCNDNTNKKRLIRYARRIFMYSTKG